MSLIYRFTVFLAAAWVLFLSGCARPPSNVLPETTLYLPVPAAAVSTTNTPAFLVKDAEKRFNKIGSPSAQPTDDHEPHIYVDPENPAVYFETQKFSTAKGHYTNLVYRIHFPEVPLSWTSINLTAGHNPGILFIYTLDEGDNLLLVTTVHSCGCYLAFFPTEAMPRDSLPADWQDQPQDIYGYTLPSSLKFPSDKTDSRITFTLESETHRISNVSLTDAPSQQGMQQVQMPVKPMLDLFALPYQGETVSFFETEGSLKGYVKNNTKILERLFISWWAFDLHVGQDKAYSIHDTSGGVFYTSLKFWAREASDLKNFPEFLKYWGWRTVTSPVVTSHLRQMHRKLLNRSALDR